MPKPSRDKTKREDPPSKQKGPRVDESAGPDPESTGHRSKSPSGLPAPDAITNALPAHAPTGQDPPSWLLEKIGAGDPVDMVVLAADIRRSTFLMKEAADLPQFARTLGNFVGAASNFIRDGSGWWDKFTGDGFLAYWPYKPSDEGSLEDTVDEVLLRAASILRTFNAAALDDFRRNSRNFPSRVGLSFGLDAGPVHMVEVAGDLTIVGPTVVGAVRMVGAATEPSELMANVYIGEFLYRRKPSRTPVDTVERCYRPTKEFDQQEVYRITFKELTVEEAFRRRGRSGDS